MKTLYKDNLRQNSVPIQPEADLMVVRCLEIIPKINTLGSPTSNIQ